jgi:hemerythrin-like domain-containing protein
MTRSSPITLHASPSAGFDEPFEMLAACHERVERMLALLERLAAHLREQGVDAAARQAAQDVMRYFDVAGPAHHEDEERHVFPRLLSQGSEEMRDVVGRLQRDHAAMTALWREVRHDLQGLAGAGWPPPEGPAPGFERWAAFAALYRAHIAIEEAQAYPAALVLVDDVARAEMGEEMARRRGVR